MPSLLSERGSTDLPTVSRQSNTFLTKRTVSFGKPKGLGNPATSIPSVAISIASTNRRTMVELGRTGLIEEVLSRTSSYNKSDVKVYLRLHSNVINVLRQSIAFLRSCFGAGTGIVVSVIKNPETEDVASLSVEIQTDLSVREARAILEDFYDKWLYTQPEEATEGLSFNLKFS